MSTEAELRFRLLREEAILPSRAFSGDAGLDLCAADAVELEPGERVSVPTGLAVELPEGTAGLVLPRSGLAARHGIALVNSPGLIDSGYRGEVSVLLLNTDRNEPFTISIGDRIAQLLVVRYEALLPALVNKLSDSDRGEGGFGSSGW